MLQPPARNNAIDEADGDHTSASSRAPSEHAAHPDHLALCWLFPPSSLPPHLLMSCHVIGRADDCDVCLVGRAVSRHHAEIARKEAATRLKDLRSTNGVFLNGVGVTDSPVAAGDVIRVGNWVGYFAADQPGTQHPGQIRELGPNLWGGDTIARALEPMRSAARSRLPLTLVGESGTGKRLVARALHAWSGRRGPFHTLNCATASEHHIEMELFGRRARRGPGAQKSKGLLDTTEHGTLLLEEASELSPALQRRLRRFLASGQEQADGASAPGNVRLVLARQEQRGRAGGPLSEALAASGASLTLWLPPLRQRVPEIPALFAHFVSVYSNGDSFAIDAELIEALCLYSWPGNVRELEFLARQLVALHQGAREIGRQHLPRRILDAMKRGARASDVVSSSDATRTTLPDVPTSGRSARCLEPFG